MAHRPAPAATARRDCPQRNGDPVTRDRREKITRPPRPTAIHAAPSPRINERPEIPGINLPHIPVNAAAITPGTRESTLATGGQNGASRAAPRPGGNQPILGLASIERSPPPATRESTGLRIHASNYPQDGNAAAKRQGNHPWPPKSFAGNRLPKTGNRPGRQRPSRRRGHHPHRVVNEQRRPAPPKRGSTTKNRNDSDTMTHPPLSRGTWMQHPHAGRNHPRRRRWQYAAATTMSRALAESNPARRNPEDGLPAAMPPRNPIPAQTP